MWDLQRSEIALEINEAVFVMSVTKFFVLQKELSLRESYSKCLEENDQLRDSLESEQLLTQQLSSKVEVLSLQVIELKELQGTKGV